MVNTNTPLFKGTVMVNTKTPLFKGPVMVNTSAPLFTEGSALEHLILPKRFEIKSLM